MKAVAYIRVSSQEQVDGPGLGQPDEQQQHHRFHRYRPDGEHRLDEQTVDEPGGQSPDGDAPGEMDGGIGHVVESDHPPHPAAPTDEDAHQPDERERLGMPHRGQRCGHRGADLSDSHLSFPMPCQQNIDSDRPTG